MSLWYVRTESVTVKTRKKIYFKCCPGGGDEYILKNGKQENEGILGRIKEKEKFLTTPNMKK